MNQNGSKSDRVAELANRLRLVQMDFADQDDETRRGYLQEEIQRALGGVVPSERRAFLEELQSRFPTWDGSAPAAPAVLTSSAPSDPLTSTPIRETSAS